ncbi:MAG: hypothetical protein ACREP0_08670 [Rhodanobacteraceae bacterium]
MNAREHPVAGQPPNWARRWHLFRRFEGTLADRYMVEEERADDARRLHAARAHRKHHAHPPHPHPPMAVLRLTFTRAQVEALKARWFALGAIATASPLLLVFALIWMLRGQP